MPLQVPLLIRVSMPDGRCVQVQAFTSTVNAHGGLLESPVKLAANQKILLINPHSGTEAGGKVIRVEGPAAAMYEIAFEFDRGAPRFWPIEFPPEDWDVKEETASDKR